MVDKNFTINKINAISVSGQQHGLVALDSQGNLTRKISKLWNDYSTTKECEILTEKLIGIPLLDYLRYSKISLKLIRAIL